MNRQVKVLNAIMANWDVVQDTIDKANDSAGAALEGNEKYLDSIQGRITAFQSAFQNLSRTTINSDLVKTTISIGTGILNITNQIGGLQKVLIPVMAMLAVAKWNSITKGIKGVGDAFKTMGGNISVARVGLTAAIAALGIAVNAYNAYRARIQEMRQTDISSAQDSTGKATNIISAVTNYERLASITNRTAQEENEFQSAVQNVNEVLGDKAAILQGLTAGTQEYSAALKEITDQELLSLSLEAQRGEIAARKNIEERADAYSFDNLLPWNDKSVAVYNSDASLYKSISPNDPVAQAFVEQYKDFEQKYTGISRAYQSMMGIHVLGPRSNKIEDVADFYYEAQSMIDQMATLAKSTGNNAYTDFGLYDSLTKYVSEYQSDIESYMNSMFLSAYKDYSLENGIPKSEEEFNALCDSIVRSTNATGAYKDAIVDMVQKVSDNALSDTVLISNSEDSIEAISSTNEELKKLISNNYLASDSYKTLSEAMTEQQKSGVISMETYQKLMETDEKLADYLTLTANGYSLNTEALNEYIKAKNEEQKIQALMRYDELAKQLEATSDATQRQALQNDMNAISAYIRELDTATGALARFNAAKSSANKDANFQQSTEIYKEIAEGNKTGKRNTDDFQTAVDYVLGDNWRDNLDKFGGSVEKAYEQAEKVSKRYSGQKDERTGAVNFMKDIDAAGFGTLDTKSGTFEFKDGVTIDQMAESMGRGKQYIIDMINLLNTYVDVGEEYQFPEIITPEDQAKIDKLKQAINEVTEAQEEAKTKLEEVNRQISEAGAGEDIAKLEQEAQRLEETISNLDSQKADLESGVSLDVDTMTLEDAREKIDELYDIISALNGEGINIPVTIADEYNTLLASFPELQDMTRQPIAIDVKANDEASPVIDNVKDNMQGVVDNDYSATISAETDNTLETVSQALDDVAKDRTATITTKYKEIPITGNEPDYVDNTHVNKDGATVGYSGVLPYQTREPDKGKDREIVPPKQAWQNSPAPQNIEVEVKTGDPSKPIAQIQEEADSNPVEIQFTAKESLGAGKAMDSLISKAEEAGVRNAEGGRSAITSLQQAYVNLSQARQKANEIDVGDEAGAAVAASELQSAASSYMEAYNTLSQMTESISVDPIEVDADTSAALEKIQAMSNNGVDVRVTANTSAANNAINALNKTVTVTVRTNTVGFAKGTKNAPNGTSLVDEKGPELIEHIKQGTFELGTNNGPRFTKLDAGDVVHTAKETKSILSRAADVGGFFRDGLNKAKSIIGGAFATGVTGKSSIASLLQSVRSTDSGSSTTTKKKSKSTSTKKLKKWAEQLFDWAEIRLKRLATITNTWILSASEAIGYIAKNKELTNAIKSVGDQIEATTQAYDLYIKQADAVAKKANLSDDIVQKIKNGTIEIAEYKTDIQEQIKLYQEW